jgi:glycosyltransferase involved in cell wall biosynthesis
MTGMADENSSPATTAGPANVALCIEAEVCRRLRPSLRHLCVGLIDHNVSGRLVSRSAEVGRLSIGPIQRVAYEQPPWLLRRLRSSRLHRMQTLAEKLADRPPTVVHAIAADAYETGLLLAGHFDVDLVLQVTSFRDIKALTPALADRADSLIAASQPLLDWLEAGRTPPERRLSVIRPGVLAGPAPTCFVRPDALPTLLCTEAFFPGSGILAVLHAAHILRQRKREFLVFLTGAGPLEAELRRRTNALGLSGTVIFAHPSAGLDRIMIGADIFIHPRMDDAIRIEPLSAMANGLAVVAVQGGAYDCFVDGVTALVLDEAKPDSLADAVERLLDDPDGAKRLAEGAINHIRTYYPISAMAGQTVQEYRALLARRQTYVLNR